MPRADAAAAAGLVLVLVALVAAVGAAADADACAEAANSTRTRTVCAADASLLQRSSSMSYAARRGSVSSYGTTSATNGRSAAVGGPGGCDLGRIQREHLDARTMFYVLNLDRRRDRLERLESFLGARAPWMCGQMCRVSAPDGQKLPSALAEELIDPSKWEDAKKRDALGTITEGGPLTRGAVGLLFGHAAVWHRIARGDQPWAVVLEDDVNELNPHLREFLCRADHLCDAEGWEYLQLQQANGRVGEGAEVGVVKGTDFNNGMYLLTREAAQRGLKALFPLAGQLDNPDGFLRGQTRSYKSVEPMAGQVGSAADTDVQIMSILQEREDGCRIEDCPPLPQDPAAEEDRALAALLGLLK